MLFKYINYHKMAQGRTHPSLLVREGGDGKLVYLLLILSILLISSRELRKNKPKPLLLFLENIVRSKLY